MQACKRQRRARRPSRPVAVLALAGAALAPLQAAPIAWVLNTNQNVEIVALASNTGGPIGNIGFASDSLARAPTGQLYAADASGNLWDVTGAPIPVGPTGRTQIGDLDWAANGLWGYANGSQELFFFDFGSSSVSYAQTIALAPGAVVTGVAHQPSSGDVYLATRQGLNNDALLRVPAAATAAISVGPLMHGDSFSYVSDIDFDAAGTLYAMTWFHRWFYTVATSNAATALVSAGPHRDTTAFALAPVPEPASAALVGAGLAFVLSWTARGGRRAATSLVGAG